MTKYFARLDENNKVINVEVVHDEDCQDESKNYSESIGINFLKKVTKWESWSGAHNKNGRCGIDGFYIPDGDYFKSAQPFPSWTFNTSTHKWDPPKPHPAPDDQQQYAWNETIGEWKPIT